jgi:hypothetical protein
MPVLIDTGPIVDEDNCSPSAQQIARRSQQVHIQ